MNGRNLQKCTIQFAEEIEGRKCRETANATPTAAMVPSGSPEKRPAVKKSPKRSQRFTAGKHTVRPRAASMPLSLAVAHGPHIREAGHQQARQLERASTPRILRARADSMFTCVKRWDRLGISLR